MNSGVRVRSGVQVLTTSPNVICQMQELTVGHQPCLLFHERFGHHLATRVQELKLPSIRIMQKSLRFKRLNVSLGIPDHAFVLGLLPANNMFCLLAFVASEPQSEVKHLSGRPCIKIE